MKNQVEVCVSNEKLDFVCVEFNQEEYINNVFNAVKQDLVHNAMLGLSCENVSKPYVSPKAVMKHLQLTNVWFKNRPNLIYVPTNQVLTY